MKFINKRRELLSLTQYRATQGANYDDFRSKDELCQALMKEQGFICCYCMQRIRPGKAHIEHWKPRSLYPELQLDYQNLLAVCDGNKGNSPHLQHCDTLKENKEIFINPTEPDCETLVKFSISGKVYSDNKKIDEELNIVLNLNYQTLRNNRKNALDDAIKNLKRVKPDGDWSKAFLKKQIHKWESFGADNKYEPYCRIVIYYLEKKLTKY